MSKSTKPLPISRRLRWFLPTVDELRIILGDARARREGKCNTRPWRADHSGGGYQHWRCQLPVGHSAADHRYRNYVWTPDGRTHFDPIPVGAPSPLINGTDRVGFGGSYRQRLQSRRAMVARSKNTKGNI